MQHFSKCRITNCCRRRSNTTIWSVFETNTGQTKYLCPGNCLTTIQNNVRTFLSWIPVTHNQLATMPFTYQEFGLYFIMHKHIESIQKHPNKLQITQFSQFSRWELPELVTSWRKHYLQDLIKWIVLKHDLKCKPKLFIWNSVYKFYVLISPTPHMWKITVFKVFDFPALPI